MLFKALAAAGVAAAMAGAAFFIGSGSVDYDASVSSAYREALLENSSFPFAAGLNVNKLEGDWSYQFGMRELLDEKTYENIKRQGFDHLRIPIDFRLIYSEETKTLDEEEISKYDRILDLAEKHGIDFLAGGNIVTWFSLILYRE